MRRRLLPLTVLSALLASVLLFATQIVTDDFNRANATTLGASWTQNSTGTLGIQSNQATFLSGGVADMAQTSFTGAAWTGGADQYAEAKIINLKSGKDMGPVARSSGSSNATVSGYLFVINEPDAAVSLGSSIACALYKVVNGTYTKLSASNFSITINANDVMRIEAQGTTIRAFQNGSAVGGSNGSVTDSAIASGNPGLYSVLVGVTDSIWDDFAAGDFSGAAVTPKRLPLLGVGSN